jgi:hypothetical protein
MLTAANISIEHFKSKAYVTPQRQNYTLSNFIWAVRYKPFQNLVAMQDGICCINRWYILKII